MDLPGFNDPELAELLAAQAADGLTDEDAVPEITETPATVTGDLWLLGDHRVLCGDATAAADTNRLMGGESADLAFSDPPYNVSYTGYTEGKLSNGSCRLPGTLSNHLGQEHFRLGCRPV